MNDISVGAVGAAFIAGVISVVGLIIGKEQKVSEFRQAWINDLRNCLIAYVSNINAISDLVRSKKPTEPPDVDKLLPLYKSLNDASHGIKLRINKKEKTAKKLLLSMTNFEVLAQSYANLTPDNIKKIEAEFLGHSGKLLKFEWDRVKRGEGIYVWTKIAAIAVIVGVVILAVYLWLSEATKGVSSATPPVFLSLQDIPMIVYVDSKITSQTTMQRARIERVRRKRRAASRQ